MKLAAAIGSLMLIFSFDAWAKTVRYELVAKNTSVNLSGKKNVDFAISINGSIPAPTLEFTEGDDVEIVVKNEVLGEELSIHWHGLLLPPEMDGVPYVTTPPISSGSSFTFRFKLRQQGTYWYHSHTATQEQKGVYGAFIVHPKNITIKADKEAVVVISDWTDENPDQVIRNLRKDGDYYQYKKNSVRSYVDAFHNKGLKSHLANEWTRMGSMDLSDVGYDAFLINGKIDSQLVMAHPGDVVRLRIINASASTYFYISLAGLPMKVVSADGTDINPIEAKEILIGMAETYDVLFTVPENRNYELRATAQDVTGFASAWIGMGTKTPAPNKPKPDPYMSMSGGHDMSQMSSASHDMSQMSGAAHDMSTMKPPQGHDMSSMKSSQGQDMTSMMDHSAHQVKSPEKKAREGTDQAKLYQKKQNESKKEASVGTTKSVETLTVDQLQSPVSTDLPSNLPVKEIKFVLGGDMERYIWYINGKTIADEYRVSIDEGEVVRVTFVNETMMHHPMHLHGHFFRVLNPEGKFSPMKHTVDVPPNGSRTIEFLANEPGDWMLHCHNLYHLKTGMARVISYAKFIPRREIQEFQKKDPHLHDHIYKDGRIEVASNHAEADVQFQRTWDAVQARIETREYNPVKEVEGDLLYRYWINRFFSVFTGGTYFEEFEKEKTRGMFGVSYLLPMLVESNLLVDHKGDVRLDLEKRLQWSTFIFSDLDVTFRQRQKTEFEISLMYANSWSWSAGLMATEDAVGIGADYRF